MGQVWRVVVTPQAEDGQEMEIPSEPQIGDANCRAAPGKPAECVHMQALHMAPVDLISTVCCTHYCCSQGGGFVCTHAHIS